MTADLHNKKDNFFDYYNEPDYNKEKEKEIDSETNSETNNDEKVMSLLQDKLTDIIISYGQIDPVFKWLKIADLLKRPVYYYKNKRYTITNVFINELIECVQNNVDKLKDQKNRDYYHYLTLYDSILSNIINKLESFYIEFDPVMLP